MKTKIISLSIAILGFASTSFAQNTASATATASGTIITPIAISKSTDLNFGNIASGTAGTVVLTPAVTAVRTPSAGITLPAGNPGTVTAAKFTVTGTSGYAYTFTVPTTSTTLTIQSGSETMTVDHFTSNAGTTITGGSVDVYVGATLNVGANQKAGVYTSGTPFTVTVNYN